MKVIYWFRQDLRLTDNPALISAAKAGEVYPIYILDDLNAGDAKMGAASRVWLYHSLSALNAVLDGRLSVFVGDASKILPELIRKEKIGGVYWNRCYEPWRIKRDSKIKKNLELEGVAVSTHNGSLLWEPWEVLKGDGTPYKVFTPYYKNGCLNAMAPRSPKRKPADLKIGGKFKNAKQIDVLELLPKKPWGESMMSRYTVGEDGAKSRLKEFLSSSLDQYKLGRDFPALKAISKLSPHLHFGELSPNQVWHAAREYKKDENLQSFLTELGWREFSYYLVYHFPTFPRENFQKKFDAFPWKSNAKQLRAWQRGMTGIPIVDAGMRELWQTGLMHNRVRMITASFLTKNCLIDWRKGEEWFWDCLVDADLASNSAGWQWVAGSGADAAPYFRIFNPVTQSQRFDSSAEYILEYVPELSKLPIKYLFAPWEAPENVLHEAGIVLGKTYPNPLVDLKVSREQALEAYASIKGSE